MGHPWRVGFACLPWGSLEKAAKRKYEVESGKYEIRIIDRKYFILKDFDNSKILNLTSYFLLPTSYFVRLWRLGFGASSPGARTRFTITPLSRYFRLLILPESLRTRMVKMGSVPSDAKFSWPASVGNTPLSLR